MKILVENTFGHGAKRLNSIHRKLRRRKKLGRASVPFDWGKGFDVRDKVGPIAIKNQGQSDSCAGQAAAYFLEIKGKQKNLPETISAKSVYSLIFAPGGGATVVALENHIGQAGANLESVVSSYFVDGSPLSEQWFEDKNWMTPNLLKDAFGRAGYIPFEVPRNIDEIAAVLRDWGALIWEIEGENNGTWLSANPQIPTGDGDKWYHFMCVIGARLVGGKKTLVVLNSWGDVGDKGIQYFGEEWMSYLEDCFTMIPAGQIAPLPTNLSPWAQFLRWFKKFLVPA